MRIAILTSGILPIPALQGGAVENLIDFYLEYNNKYKQHDISVFSVSSDKTYKIKDTPNVHYRYININSWWHRLKRKIFVSIYKPIYYNPYIEYYLYETLKQIKKEYYDIIILENRPGYAIPISKVSKAKIIIHLHNDFLNHSSKLAKEICAVTHKIITVSDYIKDRVETIGTKVPIVTVHNGIEVEKFYKAQPINRATLGFSDSDFIVLYSGRINPEKGVKELIEAFSMLNNYPSIKLLIVGGSFFGNSHCDNTYVKHLKEISSNLLDNIVFTGFIPYQNIPAYLKMADIAVIPSIWEEPFGLTCLEAISSGLPTIATNVGGIKEICNECAIIIPLKDVVNHICQAILLLYQNPILREELSIKGKEISKKFTKEKYAQSFINIINNE